MARRAILNLVAILTAFLVVSPSQALKRLMPSPPSIPQRVATSETIVLGKVTHIEGQSVMVAENPGSDKREFFIALVHVEESLKGAEGLTDIKVAFPAMPIGRLEFDEGGSEYLLQLETDQEVYLFLKPHHSGEFLIGATYYPSLNKKDATFEGNWKLAQRCGKLLADPEKGLHDKDGESRFLTAAMLILEYRTQSAMTKGKPREEPVGAKLSRLILDVLAEANWEKPDQSWGYEMRPDQLFNRLGLTAKDGWEQTATPEVAKKWLRENAEKYRIKRFVTEKK